MQKNAFSAALASIGLALSGCTSTPNVTASYYLPRATTQVQVVQTFTCPVAAIATNFSVATAVTATTTYGADYSVPPQQIDFGGYSNPFSDIDLSITRSADKRLLGVNSTSTGEGSTIIQAVVTLGTSIAGVFKGAAAGTSVCDVVRAHYSGASKDTPPSASITYFANIIFGVPATKADGTKLTYLPIGNDPDLTPNVPDVPPIGPGSVALLADRSSANLKTDLESVLGEKLQPFSISNPMATKLEPDVDWPRGKSLTTANRTISSRSVTLRNVYKDSLVLRGPFFNGKSFVDAELWRGTVMVPAGDTYLVPLPTPEAFGKSQFALTLSDAGIITKLEYGTTSGAGDAINTANALAKAVAPSSQTTKAADVQAQADLIYEQQRLLTCKTLPSSCPSK